jgi:hypothetical protein
MEKTALSLKGECRGMVRSLAMLLLPLVVVAAAPGGLIAAQAGSAGAQFLKIDVDARSSALGGASAVAEGAAAFFHNPAGGYRSADMEVSLSQVMWVRNTRYSSLAAARRFPGNRVIGLAINYLSSPVIDKYNNLGEKLGGSYTNADTSVALGYSQRIPGVLANGLEAGGTLKYISSRLEDERATAFALDAGVIYPAVPSVLDIGFVLQNIGTPLKYVYESDPLPFNAKLGCRLDIPLDLSFDKKQSIALLADANIMNDTGFYSNIGVEYKEIPGEGIAYTLRGGYQTNLADALKGVSLGLGLTYEGFSFDYAYSFLGDLGQAHRVSLSLRFGEMAPDTMDY